MVYFYYNIQNKKNSLNMLYEHILTKNTKVSDSLSCSKKTNSQHSFCTACSHFRGVLVILRDKAKAEGLE